MFFCVVFVLYDFTLNLCSLHVVWLIYRLTVGNVGCMAASLDGWTMWWTGDIAWFQLHRVTKKWQGVAKWMRSKATILDSKSLLHDVYIYMSIYIYIHWIIHIFTRKTIQQFVFDNLTVALPYRRTRGIHFCQFARRHRGCCSLGRIWRRGLWHQHRWYRWKTSWSCDSDPSFFFFFFFFFLLLLLLLFHEKWEQYYTQWKGWMMQGGRKFL